MEEGENHLRLVLQLLQERKLYAKLKKCEFWLESVAFLGNLYLKMGLLLTLRKWKQ